MVPVLESIGEVKKEPFGGGTLGEAVDMKRLEVVYWNDGKGAFILQDSKDRLLVMPASVFPNFIWYKQLATGEVTCELYEKVWFVERAARPKFVERRKKVPTGMW